MKPIRSDVSRVQSEMPGLNRSHASTLVDRE